MSHFDNYILDHYYQLHIHVHRLWSDFYSNLNDMMNVHLTIIIDLRNSEIPNFFDGDSTVYDIFNRKIRIMGKPEIVRNIRNSRKPELHMIGKVGLVRISQILDMYGDFCVQRWQLASLTCLWIHHDNYSVIKIMVNQSPQITRSTAELFVNHPHINYFSFSGCLPSSSVINGVVKGVQSLEHGELMLAIYKSHLTVCTYY